MLLEANRHSPGPERDLSREVHKAEWRIKEQKLKDDIQGLREKLTGLVRAGRGEGKGEGFSRDVLPGRGDLRPPRVTAGVENQPSRISSTKQKKGRSGPFLEVITRAALHQHNESALSRARGQKSVMHRGLKKSMQGGIQPETRVWAPS